jgi:hypothetical protein
MLAALLLALPASAATAGGGQVQSLAAQQCSQERSEVGKRVFRKRYGAKHTMRTCIKRKRAAVASALPAATGSCQQELAASGATGFLDDYLDDDVGTLDDAMAECVAESVDEILNPGDYVDDGADDEDYSRASG